MFCFPGDSVPPPTETSKLLVRILRFLFFIELLICFPKLLFSIWSFLVEFVGCGYLYYAYNQLNYCNCVVYIFFCMMNIVNILTILGNLIQQNVELMTIDAKNLLILFDSGLSFILYVVSIHFAFLGYREFKGIALDIIKASSSDNGFAFTHKNELNLETNTVNINTRTFKKDFE